MDPPQLPKNTLNPEPRATLHRRNSSQWRPPAPPVFDRVNFQQLIQPITERLRTSAVEPPRAEREVKANFEYPDVNRYALPNCNRYANNAVVTTKYNLITFLPKNLYEQFHRWANIYFLMIVGLNWIPAVAAFSRYLGIIPVALILSLTALKDGYEDYRRHRADKRVNRSMCRFVLVGDFVHLSIDEVIPADILLVRSSDPQGFAYVETSNLDGETSLKQKQVLGKMIQHSQINSNFLPPSFKATIMCEEPNEHIQKMSGSVIYPDGRREPISKDNMLLRGCSLKNTTFVEGIVLYAGHDTKAMKNNSGPRYKRSSLERLTNRFIIYCVIILVLLCLIGGIGSMLWLFSLSEYWGKILYLVDETPHPITDGLINLVSYIITYQILIPLSLYISIELIKLGQIFFISQDSHLYYEKRDRSIECRSLNIPEELGQIQYVLSDKTGTLTENKMVFRRCAIDGVDYGASEEDDERELQVSEVQVNEELKSVVENHLETDKNLYHFFMTLAICNTVVVNRQPHRDTIELGYFQDGVFNTGNSAFHLTVTDYESCGTSPPICTAASTSEQFLLPPPSPRSVAK